MVRQMKEDAKGKSEEELAPSHAMSCQAQVPELIAAQVACHEHMQLVDGHELLEPDGELFAGATALPNARGNRQIATRLNTVIRIPGLRPSSVGKRRARKKLPAPPAEVPEHGNTLPLPFSPSPLGLY